MRAQLCRRYGGPDVIELAEIPRPVPTDDEVLIRVHATTVSAGDWRVRSLVMPPGLAPFARPALGFARPRQPILGTELAGVVAQVGARVTKWRVGDAVIGFPGGAMGCHAEYRVMPANGALAPKPTALTFEEAATLCFGGTTALHFLRKAAIKPGESLLVIGAAGGVGSALVQLGRHFGAVVTGVASRANIDLVASLGAAIVIDRERQDMLGAGATYDIIADTADTTPFARAKAALNPGGRLLAIAGGMGAMLGGLLPARDGGKRVIAGPAAERAEDVRTLAELASRGVLRPVIDSRYRFEDMRAAHARVETRRKVGSVVVGVAAD
jgi:NADPH:quinone reductase-like Zn-dependent oxidoreductase